MFGKKIQNTECDNTVIKDQIIIKNVKHIMFVLFEHFRGIKNMYLHIHC